MDLFFVMTGSRPFYGLRTAGDLIIIGSNMSEPIHTVRTLLTNHTATVMASVVMRNVHLTTADISDRYVLRREPDWEGQIYDVEGKVDLQSRNLSDDLPTANT